MSAHSCLGASSASRWMVCPASVRLSKDIPSTSSIYADEGTAAHELAEMCLVNGKNTSFYLDEAIRVGKRDFEVDEEMVENVQVYVDAVRAAADGKPINAEVRFQLDWLFDDVKGTHNLPKMFGTNDASVCHTFETLHIFDLKYGAGVEVEVENNPQLMYYALGALGKDNPDMVEEVEMCIVQPRYDHPDGAVRRWRVSVDDLYKWAYETLLPSALATLDPNAKAVPGDKQCRWCKAHPCKAVTKECLSTCRAAFGETELELDQPEPDALTETELNQIMLKAPVIRKWLDAVAAVTFQRLNAGHDVADYKLVYTKPRRSWTEPEAAAVRLRELLGDKAVKFSPLGITDTTKLLKRAKLDVKVIDELTSKPEPTLTVAHVSDKRPAQAHSAVAAFGAPDDDMFD